MKDFKTSVKSSESGELGAGEETVGEAAISAKCDSVDGLVEPVSIKKKKANLKGVRKTFSGKWGSIRPWYRPGGPNRF